MRLVRLSALALLLTTFLSFAHSADVCLLLYMMADNDLEYFLRGDLEEFAPSPLIRSPSLTSWIYFDHRNFGDSFWSFDDINERLSFVYNKDGSERTGGKPEGSFYFRYDHDLGKLIIEEDLGELNSDSPQTVEDFVDTGLADCISRGSDEFMIVFSSHGGGFLGFGGDENVRRHQRNLVQANDQIVGALRSSLDKNLGSGSKFDVVGFDACLMQALGAADDFKSVAKYLLASEETEPGHGWDYTEAPQSISGSALEIAKYFQLSFLTSLHGGDTHQTPKTLSIVDLEDFETNFLVKWEALSREWAALMQANDPEVAIMLARARTTAHEFQSATDVKGKSSVDIFDFMSSFKSLCPVAQDVPLGRALEEAMLAYENMFIARGNGQGTPSGLTGMHVFFPTQTEYKEQAEYLFGDPSYSTTAAPEWLNFLKTFYAAGTPPSGGTSVCPSSSTPDDAPEDSDALLINPTFSDFIDGTHQVDAEVARSVTEVTVEYGGDATPLLEILGFVPEEGDSLYYYSGDLLGQYDGSKYSATWDRSFWIMESETTGFQEAVYVYDMSEGSKEAEVLYFPPSVNITLDDVLALSFISPIEEAIDMGAQYGYIAFSENNANDIGIVTTIALYTDAGDGTSYSEVPLFAGGQVVPIVQCDGVANGFDIFTLIGGFSPTIYDWDPNNPLAMKKIDALDFGSSTAGYYGMDITAGDESEGRYNRVTVDFGRDGRLITDDIIIQDFYIEGDYDDENFLSSFFDDLFDLFVSAGSERFTPDVGLLTTLVSLYFIW